jgi:hypothetical protein
MTDGLETTESTALDDLYELLERRGITFYAAGSKVQLEGPLWGMTSALHALIKRYRDALLDEAPEKPWACALCSVEGIEMRSSEHPEWCEDCAHWRCSRCSYDDPGDMNPDYPDLCSWCAKQWGDD